MSTEDINLHLERIASKDSEQILDTLAIFLYENIDAGDEYELDELYAWNSPVPVNTEILEPFVQSLIELTTFDSGSSVDIDSEIRMFATDLLGWTDSRAVPALIAGVGGEFASADTIGHAVRGLVRFNAVEASDIIFKSIFNADFAEFDDDEVGALDAGYDQLVALGKLDDDRAFNLLQQGLDDEDWNEMAIELLGDINTPRSQQMLDNNS